MNIINTNRVTSLVMILLLALITVPIGMVYAQHNEHDGHDHSGHNHSHSPQVSTQLQEKIRWFTVEEAYQLNKISPKPFFVDVYTDWCGWCKRMDATTFQDPAVAAYLNAYFYPVKFDAESKDTIRFLEKTFYNSQDAQVAAMLRSSDSLMKVANDSMMLMGTAKSTKDSLIMVRLAEQIRYQSNQKAQISRQARKTTHDLARDLMNGQLSYPTFVILFDSLTHNFPLKGYQKPQQLLSVLAFFGENIHVQTNDLNTFRTEFQKTFSGGNYTTPAYYTDFSKALADTVNQKKKTLLIITDNRLLSSQMLERSSFLDPEVEAILKSDYHVVKMDLTQKDSIVFKGVSYKNRVGVHDLATGFMQEENKLPMMILLDHRQNFISRVPGYFLPNDLLPVLLFFSEDVYRTKDWPTYRKEYQQELNIESKN